MREKSIHAGRLHRWIKDEFGLPILVRDRGVVLYGYAAEGLAVCRHSIAKDATVRGICNHQESDGNEKRYQRNSLERRRLLVIALVAFGCGHGLDYTRLRTVRKSITLTILHKKTRPESTPRTSKW